ncbi:MAG: uncharacterized protein H6Q05_4348 [Acidobacteria bacterium]|nr:uncharacterized protein [Acidobacteriota bacterium]
MRTHLSASQKLRQAFLATLLSGSLLAGPVRGLTQSDPQAPAGPPSPSLPEQELLKYRVEWNPPWWLFMLPSMDAGEATLRREGGVLYKDRKALKIVFTARSSGTLTRWADIHIDDCFEFTTDPETYCTFYVTKKVREGKRLRDLDITYFPDSQQIHLRETDVSGDSPRVLRDRMYDGIPPCVKDLFSALYDFRRGPLEAGTRRRVLVGEDEQVKEVEVYVEKLEQVRTQTGVHSAWRLNTVAVMGGLFKHGGQFRIWLSTDDRHMPVKFEAKASIGKVTGTLKEAKY